MNGTEPGALICVDETLELADAEVAIDNRARIEIAPAALQRVTECHRRLCKAVSEQRHVYGVTTGFGPLANRLVSADNNLELQQNLVLHLASGVGPALDWRSARAMVLSRLMSLLRGYSGAAPSAVKMLVGLLNAGLAPVIPSRGTVGASGDLTPLAHMVLCLQGKGQFLNRDGGLIDAAEGLRQVGYAPLTMCNRDGLAFVNGTSAMTGIGVLNALDAERLLTWTEVLTAAMAETMMGRVEAWGAEFSRARPHPGQARSAAHLCARVGGSDWVVREPTASRRLDLTGLDDGVCAEAEAGQDAYSLRCVPQVVGGVRDLADWHRKIVETEFASATDNPIFPQEGEVPALHGGNFMGVHVALASDAMSNGIVVLGGLVERQIARITDERLNRGLPAFLSKGTVGLQSGLMGAQVTATALLAEMRASGAASVQSISTNGANQDVVSQGTIAARLLAEKIARLSEILAIAGLAAVQAMDIRTEQHADRAFSIQAQALRTWVRRTSPPITCDRSLGAEIETLALAMRQESPPEISS